MHAAASVWRKKGDLDKAIAVYDRAVATEENVAGTYRLRAEAYAAKGDRKRALADIGCSLKFSWDAAALKVRGTLRLDEDDIDGAVHDADAMLKLQPENAAAFALRGAAYVHRKDYDRALPDLDRAIKSGSTDAVAYSARGQVYLAKNDSTRALTDFNSAIELGTISPQPYRARAMIYRGKGDSDLDQAIQRDARPADPYFMRAALRKDKGEIDQALADLNAGLKRAPDNVAGLMARAEIRQSKGDVSAAIEDYDALLRRDSNNVTALRARAAVLIKAKSYAKAVDDLDRVIKIEPENAQVYYQRGLAREQNAKRDLAIADYSEAIARDRNLTDARKALARLTDEIHHEPNEAKRAATIAPIVKQDDQPPRNDPAKAAPVLKDSKVGPRVDKADVTGALLPKDSSKTAQHGHDSKDDHRGKPSEKNTTVAKDHQKTTRPLDRRRQIIVRNDQPRYIRAGSPESRNPPRRELRFTDIWR